MTIKAHGNHIFVNPIEQSDSKLIVPPMFRRSMETVRRGTVRYAGPLSPVKPGEVIVFDKWQGGDIQIQGERLLILQPTAVIAVEA